jgi:hypothetical protein
MLLQGHCGEGEKFQIPVIPALEFGICYLKRS